MKRLLTFLVAVMAGYAFLMPTVPMMAQETDQKAAAKDESTDKKEVEEKIEMTSVTLGDGRLEMKVPKAWEKKKPANNVIEMEFAPVEKVEIKEGEEPQTDLQKARMTITAAMGSVEQNIERWKGQFTQEDDSSTSDHTQVSEKKVNGIPVHIVSITGTYDDRVGPFAGKGVSREGYRMLAAIVETKVAGTYFFKLYGPEKVVNDHEKGFKEMLESLRISL